MTTRVQPFHLRRTLQNLTTDAAAFRLAAEALEDVAIELSPSGLPEDLRKSVAKFQGGVVALGVSLLAIVRRAERAMTLANLGEEDMARDDSETSESNHFQASAEESRESAVNALAAALIKTSGGDITHREDLIPALHAAENVIEAIADYVVARQRSKFS